MGIDHAMIQLTCGLELLILLLSNWISARETKHSQPSCISTDKNRNKNSKLVL